MIKSSSDMTSICFVKYRCPTGIMYDAIISGKIHNQLTNTQAFIYNNCIIKHQSIAVENSYHFECSAYLVLLCFLCHGMRHLSPKWLDDQLFHYIYVFNLTNITNSILIIIMCIWTCQTNMKLLFHPMCKYHVKPRSYIIGGSVTDLRCVRQEMSP